VERQQRINYRLLPISKIRHSDVKKIIQRSVVKKYGKYKINVPLGAATPEKL
jgi:RNase P/RNase MRP subunit POP5